MAKLNRNDSIGIQRKGAKRPRRKENAAKPEQGRLLSQSFPRLRRQRCDAIHRFNHWLGAVGTAGALQPALIERFGEQWEWSLEDKNTLVLCRVKKKEMRRRSGKAWVDAYAQSRRI